MKTVKDVFSVGEVAKICHVSHRTVAGWIDRGELQGYRVPFSRHRRIRREELKKFMVEHQLPFEME